MFAHPNCTSKLHLQIAPICMRYGCTRRDTPLYGYCPYTTSFIRLLSVFCVAMWLTALLLGARWTPGKQWIGKHRRVLKMTDTRRRNQAERAAQIKRVGSRASVGLREMCVPIIPIDNTVSCMVYQCVCLSAYYCNTCLLLYGLVFYISPAEDLQSESKSVLQHTRFKGQNGSHAFLSWLILISLPLVYPILIYPVTDTSKGVISLLS